MATGTTCAAASRLISNTIRVGARDCTSLSGSRWQSTPSRALRTQTSSISTTSLSSSRRICSSAQASHSATSCAFRPAPRKHIISAPRRTFASSTIQRHGDITPPKPGEERKVTFVDKEGRDWTFEVADGDNLLDIAQANDLEMEGACGGSCACSTCHVIVADDAMYDKMEEPSDDENDMLDLAFGLTETSRLGCQVVMSKELDGLVVKLPSMTRNLQASDFAEKK